jgi:TetR/AcrR family transcriptional regulator, regulator of mycofactocin system
MIVEPDMETDTSTERPRQGRPRATSRRQLELVALRLFAEHGFDETTVDQVASAAGVSRRTFFRYFDSKSAVLWNTFDLEVATIRRLLSETPSDMQMMDAIRSAVVAANHYHADDVPELRTRMNLIGSVPTLQANATLHYTAWEEAIAEFVGDRIGQPASTLYPLAVSRAALAVCRAAYDRWVARADTDLQVYLDAAIQALAAGFDPDVLTTEPKPIRPRHRPVRA